MDQDDPEKRIAELERHLADAKGASRTDHGVQQPGAPSSAAAFGQYPVLTAAAVQSVAFSARHRDCADTTRTRSMRFLSWSRRRCEIRRDAPLLQKRSEMWPSPSHASENAATTKTRLMRFFTSLFSS
jgi:hypothetical protein